MANKKRKVKSEGASGRAPKSGTANEEPPKKGDKEVSNPGPMPRVGKHEVGKGRPLH